MVSTLDGSGEGIQLTSSAVSSAAIEAFFSQRVRVLAVQLHPHIGVVGQWAQLFVGSQQDMRACMEAKDELEAKGM